MATNKRSRQTNAIIWSVEPNPSLPTSWENIIGNTTPADHTLLSDPLERIQERDTPTSQGCAGGNNPRRCRALLDEPLAGDYVNPRGLVRAYNVPMKYTDLPETDGV